MQKQFYEEWPGPDDDLVIDAMLNDSNSHHWSKCQTFVNSLMPRLAGNFSADIQDEIAQSAMFSIVRYLPGFKRKCRFTSWIIKIVKSRIADAGREQQNMNRRHVSPPNDSDEDKENEAYILKISSERTAEEECILREELREVSKEFLEHLSERKIHIMKMYLAGFSLEAIAKKLHMPAANVGYAIRSAQRLLREQREQK